jgi:hypothetical protein
MSELDRWACFACYCILAIPFMLGSTAIEGGFVVRTCAIRCPAKSLLVFLIFLFAGLLFIEHFHCILSRAHVIGLHRSFRLVRQPFA